MLVPRAGTFPRWGVVPVAICGPVMKTITTLADYCREINIPAPRHPFFDIRRFEDNMATVNARQPPFRHEFYAVALRLAGQNTEVNGRPLASNLFFNSPYQVITWDIRPDWQGWYLIFGREFLGLNPAWANFIIDFPFFRLDRASPLDLPAPEAEHANLLFQKIADEYHSARPDKFLFIQAYTQLLLLTTKRFFDQAGPFSLPCFPPLNFALTVWGFAFGRDFEAQKLILLLKFN